MDISLRRAPLHGIVPAIASKSAAHRLLICAALSDSPTFVAFKGTSNDIRATIQCITAFGCTISPTSDGVLVHPPAHRLRKPHLDCLECGSTLRFMLPVAAALFEDFSMTGHGSLSGRPLGELANGITQHGCEMSNHALPFRAYGRMHSGLFQLPGNVSSQYISGLLLALPLLDGDSRIILTSPLSSAAYVDMTIQALAQFGVEVRRTSDGWHVPGGQTYRSPGHIQVEGDWSNAAVWLCAGALAGPVTVTGLNLDTVQADLAIVELLGQMGASVFLGNDSVTVSRGSLRPLTVNIDQYPDLMPILTMTLAAIDGSSLITNAARLRLKESDRLSSMSAALAALGVNAIEGRDFLALRGGTLSPGAVDSANDHRIVMAAALASSCTALSVTGVQAIEKSYPEFFRHFAALGGSIVR
ncbi:MAG: 3-phosphoshikimate 1-carboxyvinyltransferase [Candidatus Heteroscillospira sp.]|jgi:3-phosphoshikimate 1-carboxyvinyltransferase